MADDIKILYAEEKKSGAVLKVVGVGGAGGNAVNRMIEEDLKGVEFIAVNTDNQDLAQIKKPARAVQIGEKITRGLGAGSNPDIGEQAALEDTQVLLDQLEGANMVFITAGMGGGTGTGASHVIASLASQLSILTVGVVSKPFSFEREKRMQVAEEGIRKLRENVDAVIIIPNQKLLELGDSNLTFKQAYKKADEVLLQAVRGIADMINSSGDQNVDFADVRTTMIGKGLTLMGTGEAKGANRAEEAALKAIHSPLLENVSIAGATGILYNITAADNLTMAEIETISNHVTASCHPDATVKFGVITDDAMEETLRVTVIATGFNQHKDIQENTFKRMPTPPAREPQVPRQATPDKFLSRSRNPSLMDITGYINEGSFAANGSIGCDDFEDPLDKPTFLRRVESKK